MLDVSLFLLLSDSACILLKWVGIFDHDFIISFFQLLFGYNLIHVHICWMGLKLVVECMRKYHNIPGIRHLFALEGNIEPLLHFMYVAVEGNKADTRVLEGGREEHAGIEEISS